MDQISFRNYFRQLANNNLAIGNDEEKDDKFFEIIRTVDPFSGDWDADFKQSIRSRMNLKDGKCVMVIEALETEWLDPGADDKKVVPMASFIILKKSNIESAKVVASEVMQAVADTQAVCEQIFAYIEKDCYNKMHNGTMYSSLYIELTGCKFYPISPLEGNVCGTRVEFTFKTPRNYAIEYDDQWWDVPL